MRRRCRSVSSGHVGFADPICNDLPAQVLCAASRPVAPLTQGGHKWSSKDDVFHRRESRVYRSWGVDVLAMTNLPEDKLAREAEI